MISFTKMKIIEWLNASGVDVECMAYLLNKHKISIYIFDNFIQIIGVQKILDSKERKKIHCINTVVTQQRVLWQRIYFDFEYEQNKNIL